MSEIQRYMYARDGMVPDAEHLRGSGEPEFWVRFTDHEAERAENLATIDFLNKELRSAVDALADAEARIEGLVHKEQGFDNADMEYGYGRGLAESIRALAALTQPQTEKCPTCESSNPDAYGQGCNPETGFNVFHAGGGAATAAGVPDGDLVARAMAVFNSHIEAERDLEHGGMICSECGFHLGDLPVLHTTRQDHAFRMAFDATGQQEAIADPNPDKSTCVKTGRDNRTPENLCAVLSSEGEVEAVARAIAKQADARCFDVMASGKEILHYREDCDYFRGLARAAITAFRSVSSGKVVRWEDISSAIARMAEKRDVAVEECKDLATSPAGKMIYWLESGAASATHLFAGRLSEELETCQDGGDCMVISRELYHDLRQAQDELKASKAIGPQEPKAPLNQSLPSPSHPEREKECPVCDLPDCPGVWCGPIVHDSVEGEGRRSASGVADADLEAAAMEISVKATRLDPETYKVPDKLIWMLRSALFPNEDMERIKSPGPYAKAFREKFPVPEFPGIKNRQEDQA